jgi:predicted dehydrogenase
VLRGAFIGFGNVAEKGHLPGWLARDDVAIVAAVDAVAARRDAFLAAVPEARWYDTVDALLARERLDFVDLCTPPGSHAVLIQRLLGAGLHVLSEKPLVTRAADAVSVAAAAARARRTVHTVHNWLEAPICRRISTLVDEGAVGTVRGVRWETLRTQPAVTVATAGAANWRVDPAMAGGGILFDHGWHALYCVMRWAGGAARAVAATLETRRFREWPLEDTATVDLDFGAAQGRIFLTWTADARANHIEIAGEGGRLHVEGADVVVETGEGERRWSAPPPLSEGSHHPDWFAGVAASFVDAATGGGAGNLEEAVRCARLIDLAQRSSAAGGARLALED